MNAHQIIIKPLITEKNTLLMESNKYSFEVAGKANKTQIKRAIEEIFNVGVTDVNTINVRGKLRRRGQNVGYERNWKKAVVTLRAGDRIELFES